MSGNTVLVGTYTGGKVAYSTDFGSSWSTAIANSAPDNSSYDVLVGVGISGSYFYALENGGSFYRSSDSGVTWNKTSLGSNGLNAGAGYGQSLRVSGNNVYLIHINGIHISTDNGSSFSYTQNGVNGLPGGGTQSIHGSGSLVVVGSNGGGIAISTDGGASFSAITGNSNGLPAGSNVNNVIVENGKIRAFTTDGAGAWSIVTSSDNGASFTSVALPGSTSIDDLALAIEGTTLLFADSTYGFRKSTDNGTTWTLNSTTASSGFTDTQIRDFSVLDSGQTIHAVTDSSYTKTTDGGTTWTTVASGTLGAGSDLYEIESSGNNVFIATSSQFGYSTNAGASFSFVNYGTNGIPNCNYPSFLKYISSTDTLYFSCYGVTVISGLLQSTDGGATWGAVGTAGVNGFSNSSYVTSGYYSETSNTFYAGTFLGLTSTTNNGTSWNLLSEAEFQSLTFLDSSSILAPSSTELYLSSMGGIFYSDDSLSTWNSIGSGKNGYQSYYSSVGSGRRGISKSGSRICTVTSYQVLCSNDHGENWTQALDGQNGLLTSNAIEISVSGNNVYLASFSGLQRSSDGGVNWSSVTSGQNGFPASNNVTRVFSSGNNVYVVTDVGSAISTDNGANWNVITPNVNGFPNTSTHKDIWGNGTRIFVLTDQGVAMSPDHGASWGTTPLATIGLSYSESLSIIFSTNNATAGAILGTQKISITQDSGVSFTVHTVGTNNLGVDSDSLLTSASFDGTNLYVVSQSSTSFDSKIQVTTNFGTSWSEITPSNTNGYHQQGLSAYLNENSGKLYSSSWLCELIKSTNNGTSWSTLVSGTTSYGGLISLGCGYFVKSGFIIGLKSDGTGLIRSTDDGASFSTIQPRVQGLPVWGGYYKLFGE